MLGAAPHSAAAALVSLLIALACIVVYRFLVGSIEQRRVAELALSGSVSNFCSGAVIGSLLFAITIAVLAILGVATVSDTGVNVLAYAFSASLVAAITEELLLRGVLFRIIEESLGSWVALGVSALIFGALHAFNKGATVTSTMAVALEAGVLLAGVYMYTRALWMPIGVHLGWNFAEGGLFGASVSGGRARGWLTTHLQGPDLLTGGTFGPEASLVAVVVCLTAGATFLALALRKRRVVAPVWRR